MLQGYSHDRNGNPTHFLQNAAAPAAAAAPPAADADARALYTSSLAALPPALRQWLDALPSSSAAQIAAAGGGASGGGGERGGGRPQPPAAAGAPAEAGAPKRVVGAGYSPSNPNGLMSPNFALMGAQNVGMMGLGPSLYQGPDLYDPNSPWGPEPYPEQSSGPEKCYRLLNSWLYKCALSPM